MAHSTTHDTTSDYPRLPISEIPASGFLSKLLTRHPSTSSSATASSSRTSRRSFSLLSSIPDVRMSTKCFVVPNTCSRCMQFQISSLVRSHSTKSSSLQASPLLFAPLLHVAVRAVDFFSPASARHCVRSGVCRPPHPRKVIQHASRQRASLQKENL